MRDLPELPALHSGPDGRLRAHTGKSLRSSTRIRAAAARMEKPGLPQGRALEARSASQARRIAGGDRAISFAERDGSGVNRVARLVRLTSPLRGEVDLRSKSGEGALPYRETVIPHPNPLPTETSAKKVAMGRRDMILCGSEQWSDGCPISS